MRSLSQKPCLARLPALIAGFLLIISVPLAQAQTLPEIQRLMKQGQLPQALEKVDLYIASKPKDAQGRFMRGLILTDMGRTADAIAVFTRLTEDFPELPEPYNNLAVLYAQQKQYDKARGALEMAIRTHPSYAIAHENLGDVYAKLASQAYGKALQIDASNTSTQTKLSLITELISTPSRPAGKAGSASASEPVKVAAAESAKPAPAAKPEVKPTESKPAAKAPEPKPVEAKPAEVKPAAKAPEAKPAEVKPMAEAKPAEAKPAADKAAAAGTEADVARAVQAWAAAWAAKDVKAYLAFYAPDFQTPNGVSRKEWESERTQRIDKPGPIKVAVDNVKVSISGDKATARFRQLYTSATLKSSATKTLLFVKSGGKWLIQQERVG